MKTLKSIWKSIVSIFIAPKLEIELKHIITDENGIQKTVSAEEAFKITGCKVTIKMTK